MYYLQLTKFTLAFANLPTDFDNSAEQRHSKIKNDHSSMQ